MRRSLLGVIGDPIEHSLSPRLHNFVLKKLGLDSEYEYRAFRVAPAQLSHFLSQARSQGIVGLNVTIPHKQAVIKYMDALDSSAEKVGAVNTIVFHTNTLKGYNTDGAGFVRAASANEVKLHESKVVLLGAGGAAQAVAFALAESGTMQLSIYNRSVERALELKKNVLAKTKLSNICAHRLDDRECLCDDLSWSTLLINATSIGMYPNFDESPLAIPEALHPGLAICDLIYNPEETELMRQGQHRRVRVLNGLDMLIFQGLEALRLWLEQKDSSEIEKKVSLTQLRRELVEALRVPV